MAAGDQVQIVLDDVQTAGVGYTVPGGQAIQPLAVNATIDGSGAGGAFEPTLEIVSDSGHIVARCPAPQVAAGGSAEVSWFPGVKPQAVASVSEWVSIERHGLSLSLLPYPDPSYSQAFDWTGGHWRTTDSAVFTWNAGTPTVVNVGADNGDYLVVANAIVQVNIQASGGLAPYRTDAPGTFDDHGFTLEVIGNDAMVQMGGASYGLDAAQGVSYSWGAAFDGTVQPTLVLYADAWVAAVAGNSVPLTVQMNYWSRFATAAVVRAAVLRVGVIPNDTNQVNVSPLT